VIWVTEVWRSQADLDASLERIRGSEDVAATMSPVDDWEMIELELLGGKGPRVTRRRSDRHRLRRSLQSTPGLGNERASRPALVWRSLCTTSRRLV
jgi:hypothetical protein